MFCVYKRRSFGPNSFRQLQGAGLCSVQVRVTLCRFALANGSADATGSRVRARYASKCTVACASDSRILARLTARRGLRQATSHSPG